MIQGWRYFRERHTSELRRISLPHTQVNSIGWPQSVQGKGVNDGGDVEMAAVDDFDEVLERFKLAGNEFMKGNPKPVQEMFSHRDDVTLANPFGPPARGWEQVAKTQERGASYYRDGEIYDFETVAKYVTPELACILWIERTNAKVGGAEDVTPCDLRVTMTLRPEDGEWKVVHRHADPITTPRPAESVIQK
jgi:ketosteroid isomerase-like protein